MELKIYFNLIYRDQNIVAKRNLFYYYYYYEVKNNCNEVIPFKIV